MATAGAWVEMVQICTLWNLTMTPLRCSLPTACFFEKKKCLSVLSNPILFGLRNHSKQVEKIARKELTCKYKCGWFCKNTECNMAAAGGAYVGKDGKLVIYGVEHDNDGPKVGGKGSVKMMEFAEN